MTKHEEKMTAEAVVKHIRRETRRKHTAEEKIRIVLEGLVAPIRCYGGVKLWKLTLDKVARQQLHLPE